MNNLAAALALLALVLPGLAVGQVFRCTNSAGKVEYSDSPCVGGQGRAVTVNQNVLPGQAAREQVLKDENQRLRRELETTRPQSSTNSNPSPALGRTEADLSAEKGGTIECARAKRNYEVATSSIQTDRNTNADELAMYSACGIKPPDKTIVNITNVHIGNSPRPSRMTNCNSQGCWDDRGNRYQRGAGGVLFGPRGACTQVGSRLDCP